MKINPNDKILIPQQVVRLTALYNHRARTVDRQPVETVIEMLEGLTELLVHEKKGEALFYTGKPGSEFSPTFTLLLQKTSDDEHVIDTGKTFAQNRKLASALRSFAKAAQKAYPCGFDNLTPVDCMVRAARVSQSVQEGVALYGGLCYQPTPKSLGIGLSFPRFVL